MPEERSGQDMSLNGEGGAGMKQIGELRQALAYIHTYRNMAIVAVNERDKNTLLNKLKDMERQIVLIRSILEAQP